MGVWRRDADVTAQRLRSAPVRTGAAQPLRRSDLQDRLAALLFTAMERAHRGVAMGATVRWPVRCLWVIALLIGWLGGSAAPAVEPVTLHIPSTKVTLPNGLTVVVSPKDKLPMAYLSVRFRVGSAHDPEEKAGLADMTVRLLDKGTAQRTATAIAEELDFLGARLDASAGGTGSTVSLSLLAKDIDRGLGLLADLLQHSRFDAAELERERAQM